MMLTVCSKKLNFAYWKSVMEPFWSSSGYFTTQFAGSLAVDAFYGQEIASPELLLANAAGAIAATVFTDQVEAAGVMLYFVGRDQKANKGKPKHLVKDMYEAIGTGVVVGTAVNVAVRHLFFKVPLAPALIGGAISAALTWGVWVQPQLTTVAAQM